MKAITEKIAGLLVDKCLQYPIMCAFAFTLGHALFGLFHGCNLNLSWYKWMTVNVVAFVLVAGTLTAAIPSLQMTAPRVILRPTPSCSTFNNPTRYLCFILSNENVQKYYETNRRASCEADDPNIAHATPFYIRSPWIPSLEHFRLLEEIQFQPEGEGKPPYKLPKGYCIRAAGPSSLDPLPVIFYSLNGTTKIITDKGHIDKKYLEDYKFGWYFVSSCRTDLSTWLYNCTSGYLSSTYVPLSEYSKKVLMEESDSGISFLSLLSVLMGVVLSTSYLLQKQFR